MDFLIDFCHYTTIFVDIMSIYHVDLCRGVNVIVADGGGGLSLTCTVDPVVQPKIWDFFILRNVVALHSSLQNGSFVSQIQTVAEIQLLA